MLQNTNPNAVPGWIGGCAQSRPEFAYPDPDLASVPLLDNLANIDRITRQQAVYWPEFSWLTVPGDPKSRCFQRFAHDISRLGYDDAGRVWSIVCPQQGVVISGVAALNVEVTVTGQRGWTDERSRDTAADMSVQGKIWFTPSSHQNWFVSKAWDLFKAESLPFPSDKANAIVVNTHLRGAPNQPVFPLRRGQTTEFEAPAFARHTEEAWSVANLAVEIGPIEKRNHEAVDTFNQKILDVFNIGSGNMLQVGNVLTWDVWFTAPELVDTEEWASHAEKWRHSIDVDHGLSPEGSSSSTARYFDGTAFKPAEDLEDEMKDFLAILESVL